MYKLIALDLDETLLGPDGKISPINKEALAAARAMGCEVTLVTARSFRGTRAVAEELALTLPVICVTGAGVYSPAGELLRQSPVPMPAARQIAATADEQRWSIHLYFAEGRVIRSRYAEDFPMAPDARRAADPFVGDVSPILADGEAPQQIVLLGNRSVEGALSHLPAWPGVAATSYDRFGPASRTHLMCASVSKGAALEAFCRERDIPREAVIAMGDGEADRSMIEWAGAGVAMGWAPAHVQRAADLVTSPDDPHPVATALRRLLDL